MFGGQRRHMHKSSDTAGLGCGNYRSSSRHISGLKTFHIRRVDDTGNMQDGICALAQFFQTFRVVQCTRNPRNSECLGLVTPGKGPNLPSRFNKSVERHASDKSGRSGDRSSFYGARLQSNTS